MARMDKGHLVGHPMVSLIYHGNGSTEVLESHGLLLAKVHVCINITISHAVSRVTRGAERQIYPIHVAY